MRKLIRWIAVLAVVVIAFVVVNRLVDTPELTVPKTSGSGEIEVPVFDDQGNVIDNVKVGPVGVSVYRTVDKKTGKVKRIFGFDELLNPSQGSSRWRLRGPYMNVYEDKFRCEVTAETGNVEMDTTGSEPTPLDARLSDNVKIVIIGTDPANPFECTIYMDDVDYSSERSEFATNGHVKVISGESEMVGTGMLLLNNPALGRIEYLNIIDLDYIALSVLEDGSPAAAKPVVAVGSGNETVTAKPDAGKGEKDYYKCQLDKNVTIRYGQQLRVVGAELVSIDNILFSDSGKKDKNAVDAGGAEKETSTEPVIDGAAKSGDSGKIATDSEKTDIYITCDGGVMVRPMLQDEIIMAGAEPAGCMVELKGKAVEVRAILEDKGIETTVARCGIIKYDVDGNELEMRPLENGDLVTLNMSGSTQGQDIVGSSLETAGSVTWLRDKDQAKVLGPGRMVMVAGDDTSSDASKPEQNAEMLFDGLMDVAFAQDASYKMGESLLIKSAVFSGGLSAQVKGGDRGGSKMSADGADFEFDQAGDIKQAELAGNVKFDSIRGNLNTEFARIYFADNEQGKRDAVRVLCPDKSQLELYGKDKTKKNARFYAESLDHNILSGDTVAGGPVKFVFYTDDISMMGGVEKATDVKA
ncbi:MAG: hypothetical protein KAS23_07835, partial [Anaerohalosphaera sp.]|nr:hypothetical protein [Anaerohalosphaera sp.]